MLAKLFHAYLHACLSTSLPCLLTPPSLSPRSCFSCYSRKNFTLQVAVGAAHAIRAHGLRVAIVDWDCHHGNGETVKRKTTTTKTTLC